jgi:hypothetical protein
MLRPLTVGSSSAITVSDWDHDGDLDLIIGNGEGAVYWAINEGTRAKPVWGQPRRLKAGGHFLVADGGAAAPCVADWDGDGLPDLLLGSSSGKVIWCRNQGEKAKPELAAPEILVTAFPPNLTREKQWFEQPRRSGNMTSGFALRTGTATDAPICWSAITRSKASGATTTPRLGLGLSAAGSLGHFRRRGCQLESTGRQLKDRQGRQPHESANVVSPNLHRRGLPAVRTRQLDRGSQAGRSRTRTGRGLRPG